MSFTIDVSDFFNFADDCHMAGDQVTQIMHDAGFESGILVQQKAVANVAPHRKSGMLETNIGPPEVAIGPESVKVVVPAKATNPATGFPYPLVLEEGRRGGYLVTAKNAKAIPIQVGGGVIFRKSVRPGPFAGIRFMGRALDDSVPEIEATVQDGAERLVAMLRD